MDLAEIPFCLNNYRMIEEFKTQLTTAILSSPVVYIPHFHYAFVDGIIQSIVNPQEGQRKVIPLDAEDIIEFDIVRGIIDFTTKQRRKNLDTLSKLDLFLETLIEKRTFTNEKVFIFKNMGDVWSDPHIQTYFQMFASIYECDMRNPQRGNTFHQLTTLIIVSPEIVSMLPPQLEKIVTVIDVPAPTQEEIMVEVGRIPVSYEYATESQILGIRAEMCRTLQGLQLYEVNQILKSGTVRTGGFLSKTTIKLALEEKKQIVKKSGIVEVVDANVQFSEVGGLDVIKEQLEEKREIFQNLNLASECNLPLPKGILIIGMPGCGKSMIAKSVANLFDMSLLRLDINRLMGQYVGQSEANLRKALETAEAAHPCVLWIDEIEKAFAGSNNGGNNNDMLVMRLMGHFLTWMQERKTPVYIVATANDVMRPEFMRKGRFDEVYFVDFPNAAERKDIFEKKINHYKKLRSGIFDFSQLKSYERIVEQMVGTTNFGFSGAEIESLVNSVMNKKFIEYIKEKSKREATDIASIPPRKITEQDFLDEISHMKSSVLSSHTSKAVNEYDRLREKTNVERIRDLRDTYQFTSASRETKKR